MFAITEVLLRMVPAMSYCHIMQIADVCFTQSSLPLREFVIKLAYVLYINLQTSKQRNA